MKKQLQDKNESIEGFYHNFGFVYQLLLFVIFFLGLIFVCLKQYHSLHLQKMKILYNFQVSKWLTDKPLGNTMCIS